MKELCFVKFMIMKGSRSSLMISNYKVQKETAKRVYYYEFLDEDTEEDEVLYIDKKSLNNLVVENRGQHSTIAYNWCYKEDVDKTKEEVISGLKSHLESLINGLSSYAEKERNRYKL